MIDDDAGVRSLAVFNELDALKIGRITKEPIDVSALIYGQLEPVQLVQPTD